MSLAKDLARAGAEVLDRFIPNWTREIDTARIDIDSGHYQPQRRETCGCILAQLGYREYDGVLYATYSDGKERLAKAMGSSDEYYALDGESDWVYEHGFMRNPMEVTLAELNDAWVAEVEERRADKPEFIEFELPAGS
jgi:hypothetical protein